MRPLIEVVALVLCILGPETTNAQVLQGQWVDEAEAAINKHRKTDAIVIVIDQHDQAVTGATVTLKQLRHDFVVGLTLPVDRLPPDHVEKLPVYRCFNSIAMDRMTDWSYPPKPSELAPEEVGKAWRYMLDPIQIAYGRVVSADTARNSDKLALLGPTDLRDAVMARVNMATNSRPAADQYDLYADLLYQDLIERKLGKGMLHRMFEHARAGRPDADFNLRVRNAISLQRGRELSLAVQRLEAMQVPFEGVTIEQRFIGQVQPRPLARMLDDHVGTLPVPVTLAGLEVGGPSDVAAGLNAETLLRLVFAQPKIQGIYFSGVLASEVVEEHAALIDADGNPTAAGQALDQLFNTHWRSNITGKSDERGNVAARVFTGWYEITVKLPNGLEMNGKAYIPKSDRAKLIVMQQTAAEDQ